MKTYIYIILMMAFFWICATGCSQKISTSPSKKDYALKESKRNHYYKAARRNFNK